MAKQIITSKRLDIESRLAKLFRGFSDRSRLSILLSMETESKTVNEIVEATGLSQPNVSNHLSCLRECGLVVSTAQGKYNIYQLSDTGVRQILVCARELVDKTGVNLDSCRNYQLPSI
ncbi:MAG: metalloregulator ArsR/SmtB family transcription factor [Candidatus Obscuribacterales bacterium]|jgi:DNA-binding transcriptional ArsR family regulator|nr:metalloregulator ArsR/SmtB family transcription factor [Candidatus Obscuribacterales bacterium]